MIYKDDAFSILDMLLVTELEVEGAPGTANDSAVSA